MILFRCNVSPSVGVGHLMRCRTLATMLTRRGVACAMAGPDKTWCRSNDAGLFEDWTPLPWTSGEEDATAFIDPAEFAGRMAGEAKREVFLARSSIRMTYAVKSAYAGMSRSRNWNCSPTPGPATPTGSKRTNQPWWIRSRD